MGRSRTTLVLSGIAALSVCATGGCSGHTDVEANGSSTGGGSGTTGGSTTGNASGSASATSGASLTTGGGGAAGLRLDAGSEAFGPLSIAAGGGEGELFFSISDADGGYAYVLQHLTSTGTAFQGLVPVASGRPLSIPRVAVSSDGTEVSCCWEDYGGIAGSNTQGQVVRCNTVPTRGSATDLALQGGFSDLGISPALAQGTGLAALAYTEAQDEFMTEAILTSGLAPQPNNLQGDFVIQEWHLAASGGSFNLFVSDGSSVDAVAWGHVLAGDGGAAPTGLSADGGFAVTSSPGMGEGTLTALLANQGGQVLAEIYGLKHPPTATVSTSGAGPLAAVTCGAGSFGVAYALGGGKVGFRTIDYTAALGPERLIQTGFGADVTSLGMALVGGEVLVAAGIGSEIAVFAVPCL